MTYRLTNLLCLAICISYFLSSFPAFAQSSQDHRFIWSGDDGRKVEVINLTGHASDLRVATLLTVADRGMENTTPLFTSGNGLLGWNSSTSSKDTSSAPLDRVIATPTSMVWIDSSGRGGLMRGMWGMTGTQNNYNFQYYASGGGWAPNWLMPGSAANQMPNPDFNDDHAVDGFQFLYRGKGYDDGVDSLVIKNSNRTQDNTLINTAYGQERYFQFTGYLEDQLTNAGKLQNPNNPSHFDPDPDDQIDQKFRIGYTLSYRFADPDYTDQARQDTGKFRIELALHVEDVDSPGSGDSIEAHVATMSLSTSRQRASYDPLLYAAEGHEKRQRISNGSPTVTDQTYPSGGVSMDDQALIDLGFLGAPGHDHWIEQINGLEGPGPHQPGQLYNPDKFIEDDTAFLFGNDDQFSTTGGKMQWALTVPGDAVYGDMLDIIQVYNGQLDTVAVDSMIWTIYETGTPWYPYLTWQDGSTYIYAIDIDMATVSGSGLFGLPPIPEPASAFVMLGFSAALLSKRIRMT